jgi:DNA helicase II / ATP-dependent DNA helicase PcrA
MDVSNLNPQQAQAVLHNHSTGGPLLILAGAGSGKTAVLTKRIQYLIANEVQGKNILALTFTVKAAHEMRERLNNSDVLLCTFHSLAYKIVKHSGQPARQQLPHAQNKPQSGQTQEEFDFDHLIDQAMGLLDQPKIAHYWQHTFTHILIDEYQDINQHQMQFVRLLLGNSQNLFVVGDDDQSIYGFRGSDITNILRFEEHYPHCTRIKLEYNYRSTPPILALANTIFCKKEPAHLRKTLKVGSNNPALLFKATLPVEYWQTTNSLQELQKIKTRVLDFKQKYTLQYHHFAILVRYNKQVAYYKQGLKYLDIPIANETGTGGLIIQTLHASKGLQYPVVFYAGVSKGFAPADCRDKAKAQQHYEEEKRLFYVGVTRAESVLVLCHCKECYWKGKLQKRKPSPYTQYFNPSSFMRKFLHYSK